MGRQTEETCGSGNQTKPCRGSIRIFLIAMTEIICCKAGGGIVMWWSWEGLVVASMQNILVIPVTCGHRMMPHNLTGMLTNTNGVVDPSVFNSFQFTKLSVQFGTAYFPMRCPAKSKLDIPKS